MSFSRDVADWRSHRLGHSTYGPSSSPHQQQRTASPYRHSPAPAPRPSTSHSHQHHSHSHAHHGHTNGSPLRPSPSVSTWDGRPRSSSPLRSHSPPVGMGAGRVSANAYGGWQPDATPAYGSPGGYGGGSSSPRDYPESPRRRERDHSPPPPPIAPNSPRRGGPAGYGGGGGGGLGPPMPMNMSMQNGGSAGGGQWMSSPITQVPQTGVADEPLTLPADFIPPEPDPGSFTPLLPPKDRSMANRHTLVLDLDETLVHSSFKPVPMTDMLIDIKLEGQVHQVYVKKRPYVDEFLARMTELFEVVVLTASLDVYADPVLDELDYDGYWVHHRLFRDSCANLNGSYIKDLSYLGRPLNSVIIIDNSPTSYLFQPRNAIPITSWFDDQSDRELRDLIPLLEQVAVAKDIFPLLQRYQQVVARGNRW